MCGTSHVAYPSLVVAFYNNPRPLHSVAPQIFFRSTMKASEIIMIGVKNFLAVAARAGLLAALTAIPALAQGSPAAAASAPAPSSVPAQKLNLRGLPNAGKISDALFRGAQPEREGYSQLKQLGITTVVDLHNTGEDQNEERQAVTALGMRYVTLPANPFYGPSDSQVAEFLKILQDNPDQKVFVHCTLGADRTGMMVAAYRIALEKWTVDQAYNEMREFHFHTFLYPISRYLKRFPQNYAQNPAFAGVRPAPAAN
jgi:tyrosine-protein phosphatase SIW14